MAKQFNQNLKLVIPAAYASGQDLEEEVDKYMAAYRSNPHVVTGHTPNKLMFNREIDTKLPESQLYPRPPQHKEARKRDSEAKQATKTRYVKKSGRPGVQEEGDHNHHKGTQGPPPNATGGTGNWSRPDRTTSNYPTTTKRVPSP